MNLNYTGFTYPTAIFLYQPRLFQDRKKFYVGDRIIMKIKKCLLYNLILSNSISIIQKRKYGMQ